MTESSSGRDGSRPAVDRLRIDRTPHAPRRRRRGVLLVILALLSLGILWWAVGFGGFAPAVRTGRVARVAATDGVVRTTASGYVVARTRAAISSRLSGRLEHLAVDVGDRVEEGQLIGQLGHDDLDAAVARAEAELAVRRAEIEVVRTQAAEARAAASAAAGRTSETESAARQERARAEEVQRVLDSLVDLGRRGAATADEIERARAELKVQQERVSAAEAAATTAGAAAEQARLGADAAAARIPAAEAARDAARAGLAEAQALRQDADIRAPFAGIVLRKEAEVGEMVAPVNAVGSTTRGALVTLADFSSLEMEVDVIERDVGLVEEGSPARIVLDSRRGRPYAGVVRQRVPTADRTTSTVQVKVAFLELDEHVLPEMGGRVEFLEAGAGARAVERDRVLLPREALIDSGGEQAVLLVVEGRVLRRGVRTRPAKDEGRVEVLEGLTGGEDVVLDPPQGLTDGAAVRVTTSSDPE